MVTLYNVVSSDGYIAREDGSEDFIPDELWPLPLEVFKKFDVLVMGRKTYEALQSYDKELLEPLEDLALKKVVISRNKNLQVASGYTVVETPEDAMTLGSKILVSSGPTLNNYLLDKELVNEVLLHEVPIAIHEGIPVFDSRHRASLSLESESDAGLAKELKYRCAQ